MIKIAFSTLLATSTLFAGVHAHKHWSYDGETSPTHWGEMDHKYATCGGGKSQSPIDLTSVILKPHGHALKVNYKKAFELDEVNNGHTIQLNDQSGKNSIVFDNKIYTLKQFHFHSKSEHTVNGEHAELVAHFVHQAKDGSLAVVGVLFDEGAENKVLKSAWAVMPEHAKEHIHNLSHIDVASLVPDGSDYFTYMGSLTTPPCTEGVRWVILKKRATVSKAQLDHFKKLYNHNYRPINPLNNRKVEEVF
jgi:carbonic anhydrase